MDSSRYNIEISVATDYLDGQSDPDNDRYVFAYTVTIVNKGDMPAQLLTRHWIIRDANDKVEEVRGEGVIGEQPRLAPGKGFTYTSGTIIATPVGTMGGSYQMIAEDGTHFDAKIPDFTLSMPRTLH
ncbi:MAG: Co2+/Mg2+ efflux protein ApaG [Acidiferrobacterales bacterium]